MTITIDHLVKTFGTASALNGVSLEIPDKSFVALLGPSGSGKTTLLRIIAGLETADSGHVLFGGEDVTDRPVQRRNIGFVFQHYALFRHMTVAQNIAFGLTVMKRRDRPTKAAIAARVEELLTLVQLPGLGGRFPSQLSGGQRQRVASCAGRCARSTTVSGSPRSSSRTIARRRSRSPTRWRSCRRARSSNSPPRARSSRRRPAISCGIS